MSTELIHDWYILGVKIANDTLTLEIELKGKRKQIDFLRVSRFVMQKFCMQNIIYDLTFLVETNGEFSEALEKLFQVDIRIPKQPKKIAMLSASAGAELFVECDDVKIRERI